MASIHTDQPAIRTLLRRKMALVLIVFTLTCIIVWIGLSLYFSFKKTSLPLNVQKQLQPLSPVLDVETLKSLNSRRVYTQEELAAFEVVREVTEDQSGNKIPGSTTTLATPTPTPVAPSATATASATPNPSPSPSSTPTIVP